MKNDKIVTINGQKYNSVTGLPVNEAPTKPETITNRSAVDLPTPDIKKPQPNAIKGKVNDIKTLTRKVGLRMDIVRSKSISHFASQTVKPADKPKTTPNSKGKHMDIGPIKHPLAEKVENKRSLAKKTANQPATFKSAKEIKQQAISEALNTPSVKTSHKKSFFKRKSKIINIFSICIIVLIIAGYFAYINMPNISVKIASAQAGIKATYPEYCPDGYSMDGSVSYADNQVTINFRANTGNSKFAIKQSKSSWDSSAVKMQINKESNNQTNETKEGGLTIYTYNDNSNAAWVNGGILYTITGDARLSGEQIRHIATSL